MSTNMALSSFEFVIQEPDKGFSKVTQTKIRRQAMKAVAAARRQAGQYGKHNMRQNVVLNTVTDSVLPSTVLPIGSDKGVMAHKKRTDTDEGDDYHCPNPVNGRPATTQTESSLNDFRTTIPLSGLELILMDYSVQPADLSALTSINIAPVATSILVMQPAKLRDLLSSRQWSYFEHLYARYGHSACLDDAIRCLITVAQDLLAPSSRTSNALILSRYGTALKSLQEAIDTPNGWSDPDTLCATNMLQLFAVLYPAACTGQTWSQHLAGFMRMMQLKGPHDFKTEYEKALLSNVAGTITTETFFRNEVSFLEEPEWQETIRSCQLQTDDFFADRSPLVIEMSNIILRLPGACKRVGDVVCSDQPTASQIEAVRQEVRLLRREIRLWRNKFDIKLILDLPSLKVSLKNNCKRIDALGHALLCEAVLARLMGSVTVSDRFLMEDEVQEAGSYLNKIVETFELNNYRTTFYLSQKARITASLMKTSHFWRAPCLSGDLIEAWKFRQWCDAVPRQSP